MPDPAFRTTHWSMVLAAGSAENEEQRAAALGKLCQTYWFPVYAFVRKRGYSAHDAEDLTQGFFTYILEKEFLKKAREDRGYFRGFLLSALKFYLSNEKQRATRWRRGGRAVTVEIDEQQAESWMNALACPDPDPAASYEKSWALTVLEGAMARLADEQKAAGKSEIFARLKPYVREDPAEGDYERLATDLGMPRGTVTVTVYRLTQRFRDLVRTEIAETVEWPDMVDIELEHLKQALADL